MAAHETHAVTGAFGFSGKYIARHLLAKGIRVITLTNSSGTPHPFGAAVPAYPLCFQHPDRLAESLRGVRVLYNTYWVRFNMNGFSFAQAVRNSQILFRAAVRSGVQKIVHTSITNADPNSRLGYFRGKARVEAALQHCGTAHTILRPALFFGREGILINNIAWMLRKFPVFAVFGDGNYRLRPIFVDDFAALAVASADHPDNEIIDAVGPETFRFKDLVRTLGRTIGQTRPVISVPPSVGLLAGQMIGAAVKDVVITRDEIRGLMQERLYVDSPTTGQTKLTRWARARAGILGDRYQSELARRRNNAQ